MSSSSWPINVLYRPNIKPGAPQDCSSSFSITPNFQFLPQRPISEEEEDRVAMLRSSSMAGIRRLFSAGRAKFSSFSSTFHAPLNGSGILHDSFPLPASRICMSELASWDRTGRSPFNRFFSSDLSPLPVFSDPDVEAPFKELMAASWDEIPDGVVLDVKNALSKTTDDKAGQETLIAVFRAAEASVEFGAILVQLRMALDDAIGIVGENTQKLPNTMLDALDTAYKRYMAYLAAFSPDEAYLKKKVEVELGTKMVHLKMRCSGLGSEWGKVSVLGTSGLSGSYVEKRAR
ncbi:succinate dehydrogenase 5 [Wolffia australiana]